MEVVWKCPVPVVDSEQYSVVSSVVESGIKLFLHQRNQIPVTLEQMTRVKTSKQIFHEGGRSLGLDSEYGHGGDCKKLQPRERINLMVSNRKEYQKRLRQEKIADRLSKQEERYVEAITGCLKMLQNIITLKQSIVGVGLFFGSSVNSAKELIIFDISTTTERSRVKENRERINISNIIRNFYKTIIMSTEFVEFTSKNLHSTRTHICFLSSRDLHSNSNNVDVENIVLLDNATPFSSQLHQHRNDVRIRLRCTGPRRKVLRIRIHFETEYNSENRILIETGDCKVDYFADLESLFCYQIPLQLKRIISCKTNV